MRFWAVKLDIIAKLLLLVPAQFISELSIKLAQFFNDVDNTDVWQSKHTSIIQCVSEFCDK